MKIAVVYDSQSGNTRLLAEAVSEGASEFEGAEVRLKTVDEASEEDLFWADGIALGSPCHCGLMSAKMKGFLDGSLQAWGKVGTKVGCAFSTAGGQGGGAELACMSILNALINYGYLVFGVPDYVVTGVTLHYGAVAVGRPNENELDAGRLLGHRLAQHLSRIRPAS